MVMDSRNTIHRNNSRTHRLLTCFTKPVTDDDKEEATLTTPATKNRKKRKHMWKALGMALKGTAMMRISKKRKNKEKTRRSKDDDDDKHEGDDKLSMPLHKISTHKTTSNDSSDFGSSSSLSSFSVSSSSSFSSSSSRSSALSRSFSSSPKLTYSPRGRCGSMMSRHHRQINNVENNNNGRKGRACSNIALFMIINGLLFMLLWGKCLAIVYTCAWFYWVRPSRRRPCNKQLQYRSDRCEFDSVGMPQRSNAFVSSPSSISMPTS